MADTIKFSQLGEISRAQMAGSDYAVGYKANGDNKKWTFENQADFLLNDSKAGQEFQETFVKVQDTEPTDENNKIWIEETPEAEVEVPTYDEFKDLSNLVSGVNEAVFNKLSATADQLSTYIPFTFSTFAGKRYIIKNESSTGGMLARIRQTRDGENGTYITNGTQAGQTSVYEAAEDADYIAVMFGPTATNPAFSIIQEGDVPSKVEEISDDVEDLKSALNLTNETIKNGFINWNTFVQGARGIDVVVTELSTRCTTSIVFELHEGDNIAVSNIDSGLKVSVAGVASGQWVKDSGWKTANYSYTVASGKEATYFVNVAKTDNSNITPSDITTLNVMITPNTSISKLKNNVDALGITAEEFNKYAVKRNMFNGNMHSGIHSQTNGDNYGTYSVNANYFYTDLMGITQRLYVFSDFIGSTTVYVTFFNENGVIIGKQNGINPMITTFPTGTKYFCVCVHVSVSSTLIISEELPDRYYSNNVFSTAETTNKANTSCKRLDKGVEIDYYVSASNGGNIYPLKAGSNLIASFPFSVKDLSAVSYRNNSRYYPQLVFADASGKKISDTSITAYAVGTVQVPNNAEFALYYSSSFDTENLITFVGGSDAPSGIYPYDAISIEGLYADNTNNYLYGKKLLFIGDSITAGSNYNGGWVQLIQSNYNCFCTNEGHDGWTIGILPDRTDNLLQLLPTLGNDYDIIALSGGYNDFTTTPRAEIGAITPYTYSELDASTFCGSLESYLRTARTKWIDSKICFILTMRKEFTDTTTNERQVTYWNLIRQACKKYAIPLLDLYDNSGLVGVVVEGVADLVTTTYYHNADGTHPNQLGYEYLTPQIAKFLMTL